MADNSNAAGFAALEAMIAKCRNLKDMPAEAAHEVKDALQALIATSIAATRTPEGEQWKATADGHVPLQGAMGAITFEVGATEIVAVMKGVEVFHQRGTNSATANKAAAKAGKARKASRAAAAEAKTLGKKLARAAAAAGKRKTRKGREKAAAKAAELATQSKAASRKAAAAEFHATTATEAAASAKKRVGGLPARPMLPESMPMALTEATMQIF